MKHFIRILFLFSLIAWIEKPALAQKKKIIGIQKTACYGACPVYAMEILDNCKVILRAEKFVKMGEGEFKSKLSRSQYDGLIKTFRESDYFTLEEIYRSRASDLPTTYFYFRDEGREKIIEVYGDWPDKLLEVDKRLEELIENLQWKKVKSSNK